MRRRVQWMFAAFLVAIARGNLVAQPKPRSKVVRLGEQYAFMPDNQRYFILSAQIHNSGSWPAMLPGAMMLAEDLHANTVEFPVYWNTIEEQPGEMTLRISMRWFGRPARIFSTSFSCGLAAGRPAAAILWNRS